MIQSHNVHRNQYSTWELIWGLALYSKFDKNTWELNWGLALYSKFDKNTTIIPQKLQINTDIYTPYAY